MPARSVTVAAGSRLSPTTPVTRFARSPPETVTPYPPTRPATEVTDVTVAVEPLTAKSAALTPVTTESNTTRKVSESELVVDARGQKRVMVETRGEAVSIVVVQPSEVPLELVLLFTMTLALAVNT